jgi:hypothetical protein
MMKYGTAYDNFIRFTVTETGTIVANQPNAPLLTSSYPGPCNGGSGETGGPFGTPEQQQQTPEPVYP